MSTNIAKALGEYAIKKLKEAKQPAQSLGWLEMAIRQWVREVTVEEDSDETRTPCYLPAVETGEEDIGEENEKARV